ncbi:MAG: sulfurtransferase TusA family protein [Blastomonas sp.]
MESAAPALIDTRGMLCPWPALRTARAMRVSSALKILFDDPQAEREITALAQEKGWTINACPGGFELSGPNRTD